MRRTDLPDARVRVQRRCRNCESDVLVRDAREGVIHVNGRYVCRDRDTVAE